MINCHSHQVSYRPRQNSIYNFVFNTKEKRSISLKVEQLRQITETQEIKQQFYRGLLMGKKSENALRVIHLKLEQQRLRRQSYEVRTEMNEEEQKILPAIDQKYYKKPPPVPIKLENKENVLLNMRKKRKRKINQKLNSDPTIEFTPWENDHNQQFDFY